MASIRMSSSMRLSFTGAQVLCTMKQLEPRTLSCRETLVSPSLNLPTAQRPGVSPRHEQMLSAMFLLDPAEKILISLPCKFNADLPPVRKTLRNAGPGSPPGGRSVLIPLAGIHQKYSSFFYYLSSWNNLQVKT